MTKRARKQQSSKTAETVATDLYRRAGLAVRRPVGAYDLAVALLGRDCLYKSEGLLGGSLGELCRPAKGRGWRINVSTVCKPAERAFVVYHELAHFWLIVTGRRVADVERFCDDVATTLYRDIDGLDTADLSPSVLAHAG